MSLELARKRARLFFQYHKLSLPVDIEKILNSYASVEETYIPIDGDAICINNIEMPHIIIKSNMSPYRKRFTYAHELAHLQIPSHTGMISCTTEFSDSIDMTAYYKMEQEANAFAAELLMPSDWLASLISTHTNLSDLIDYIMEKANVSFSAVVYNIIPLLSPNHLFIIYNKINEYTQIKLGGNVTRPLLLYSDEHEMDMFWLDVNCANYETIDNDAMELSVCHFKTIVESDKLKKIANMFSDESSCKSLCHKLTHSTSISFAHFFKDIMAFLSPGFIIKIKCILSGNYTYIHSPDTYIRSRYYDDDNKMEWFSDNCNFHVYSYGKEIELNIWYFTTSFEFDYNPDDARDSKSILRNIIDNMYYDKKEKASIFGRVNGIIGSLNSSTKKYTKQQFYNILKQKFYSRTDLEFITEHKDFNQFLYAKIEELFKK